MNTFYALRPSFFIISKMLLWICLCSVTNLQAQIVLRTQNPSAIIQQEFVGNNPHVKIENIQFKGAEEAIALFYNPNNDLPINKGFVITTGHVNTILGPNESAKSGKANYSGSNKRLSRLANGETFDASVLSFDFSANSNQIEFQYFFASEEYPEYVDKGVNDVFAFFVKHDSSNVPVNIALVPGTNLPVSVDCVNSTKNAAYYVANPLWSIDYYTQVNKDEAMAQISYYFEFDGYTTALIAKTNVIPYHKYSLSLAIADVGDDIYDSGVFVKRQSFRSVGPPLAIADLIISDTLRMNLEWCGAEVIYLKPDSLLIDMPINFDFNAAEISKEYDALLRSLSKQLNIFFDTKIQLIGHTDRVGSEAYNLELSIQRAQVVSNCLTVNGVGEDRLEVQGRGAAEPISKVDMAKNRRVTIVLYK